MLNQGKSARSLLLAIGVGDFDATMIIPYLFMAPAQTDPQMAQIVLMTKQLQKIMIRMGAPLPATGSIDSAWVPYFASAVGPDWIDAPWAEIISAVLEAKAANRIMEIAPRRARRGNVMLGDDASDQAAVEALLNSGSSSSSSNPFQTVFDLFSLPVVVPATDPAATGANQTANGQGTITSDDFRTMGGVCKPNNFPAMNFAKELQLQLNRVASAIGASSITVDGGIGPGTLSLLNKAQQRSGGTIGVNTTQCIFVASDVDVLIGPVQELADKLKAAQPSAAARAKAAGAGTVVRKDPKTGKDVNVKPPGAGAGSLLDTFKAMSKPQIVIFTGLMGGIGYMVYRKVTKPAAPAKKSKGK